MTSQASNLLLLSICLTAILLSGGVVGGLAPGGAGIAISLERSSLDCPDEDDPDARITRFCADSGLPPPPDLIPPLFSLLESSSGGSGDSEGQDEAESGTDSTATPTGSPSPGDEVTSSETPTGGAAQAGTQGELPATGTGQTQAGAGSTESPTMTDSLGGTTGTDQAQAGTGPTESPTPKQGGGIDFGVPLRFLLLGALLVLVLVLAGASIYAHRRGYIESPWNVLALIQLGFGWLLTFVVGISVGLAEELRRLFRRLVDSLPGRRRAAPSAGASDASTLIARLVTRVRAGLRSVFAMAALLEALRERAAGGQTASGAAGDGSIDRIEALLEEEFDVGLAWGWLADQTGAVRTGEQTPEEIARDAQAQGYPAEAVTALLDAFRDVTYGGYDLSAPQRQAARKAFDQLLEAGRTGQSGTGTDQ